MKRLSLLFILAASAATAGPATVEVVEVPDGFHAIPLTKVPWAKNSAEGRAARDACGGDFTFTGWRWEGRTLIHIATCK